MLQFSRLHAIYARGEARAGSPLPTTLTSYPVATGNVIRLWSSGANRRPLIKIQSRERGSLLRPPP